MKVMIVGYSTNVGGAEKRMVSFANYCSRNNCDVKLVTFKPGNKDFTNILNENITHITFNSNVNIGSIFKLFKLIKQMAPDRVYGFLGHINIVLGFLKKLFPNTIFLGRENATYKVYFREKGNKGKLLKIINKIFIKQLDFIVAQSNYMKNDLIELFNVPTDKIIVLQNPIPEIKKSNDDIFEFNKNSKYLLSVGRLHHVKNQIEMIEVLTLLPSNYELILIGEGDLYNDLKQSVLDLNLDKRVHFRGFSNNVSYYYKYCNLLLLTSHRETSPNVVLEATAHELFSVTYNMPGGIEDLIIEGLNGEIVEQNNINFLSKAILKNIDRKATVKPDYLLDEENYNKNMLNIGAGI